MIENMTLQERVKKIFAEHNINYDCEYTFQLK